MRNLVTHIESTNVRRSGQNRNEAVEGVAVLDQAQAFSVEADGCQHVGDTGDGFSGMHQATLLQVQCLSLGELGTLISDIRWRLV